MNGMLTALGVAVAGGLGAGLRYMVDMGLTALLRPKFPWGIMVVNLTGSFALGLLAGVATDTVVGSAVTIGFLGGYTTFSTVSLDTVVLLRRRRIKAAILNGPVMLAVSVGLAALGIVLVRAPV